MGPLEASKRWDGWTVTGTPSQIAAVLTNLEGNLPTGWRQVGGDGPSLHRQNSVGVSQRFDKPDQGPFAGRYVLETPDYLPGVILSILLRGDSELHGGPVYMNLAAVFPHSDQPSAKLLWEHVMRFLTDGISPAARAAGAVVRILSPGESFFAELPSDVRDCLRAFSQVSTKSFPLGREQADLWHAFVITAFRARAVIDPQPFVDWLVTTGWSQEAAEELSRRFTDECLLLTQYADGVSAA